MADFAKLDVKIKRVAVHDGVEQSVWHKFRHEPAKQAGATADWIFMVWVRANWDHLRKLPADLNPTNPRDAEKGPPAQIDVYTGGSIRWSDVAVPKGGDLTQSAQAGSEEQRS